MTASQECVQLFEFDMLESMKVDLETDRATPAFADDVGLKDYATILYRGAPIEVNLDLIDGSL